MTARICKRCGSDGFIKNGGKYKDNPAGSYRIQRLKCRNCGLSVEGERRNGSRPEVVIPPKIEVTVPAYTSRGLRIPIAWLRAFDDIVILNEKVKE